MDENFGVNIDEKWNILLFVNIYVPLHISNFVNIDAISWVIMWQNVPTLETIGIIFCGLPWQGINICDIVNIGDLLMEHEIFSKYKIFIWEQSSHAVVATNDTVHERQYLLLYLFLCMPWEQRLRRHQWEKAKLIIVAETNGDLWLDGLMGWPFEGARGWQKLWNPTPMLSTVKVLWTSKAS